MKKLFILLLSIGLVGSAAAQRGVHGGFYHGGGYRYRPTVVVGFGGYFPFYPYPYWGYGPYYPYPGYAYGYRPSRMTMQIEDIKMDYRDKITSVKEDKTLTHRERRDKIHQLKLERDQKIDNLRRNYYKN